MIVRLFGKYILAEKNTKKRKIPKIIKTLVVTKTGILGIFKYFIEHSTLENVYIKFD